MLIQTLSGVQGQIAITTYKRVKTARCNVSVAWKYASNAVLSGMVKLNAHKQWIKNFLTGQPIMGTLVIVLSAKLDLRKYQDVII